MIPVERLTIFMRLGQFHHLARQNLGNASDASADDEQTARSSFDDTRAKRLGQGRVDENLAFDQVLRMFGKVMIFAL